MSNLPADLGKEVVEDALLAQIVAMSLEQVPEYKIADSLKLSRYKVRKMRNSDEFKNAIGEIKDRALTSAAINFLATIDKLAPLAYAALKKNLEDNKLDAVRVFVEVTGIKKTEDKPQQDSSITIVMPGATQETVISAEGKEV